MCGICGTVRPASSRRPLRREELLAMRATLRHRGPDEAGLWMGERAGLGHRRLSIIDLQGGQQPMASDDGALRIAYNGEVYNHDRLRGELEGRGHRYRTRCDTESVLRLYEAEGRSAVERLRGMFAFAIWDDRSDELFLARDPTGIKPLYYAHLSDGSLYFASEIKALLASDAITARLDADVLPDYLANHAPSGDRTLFENIRRLPPGHTLRWRDGKIDVQSYWRPSFRPDHHAERSGADLVEEFRHLFREAVRMRLMSDVPLGVFLSGGLDSASITAMMARSVDAPIRTFSVAFAEREANELRYARTVAEAFETDHHEVLLDSDEFFELLPRMIWHEDEPLAHPSSIPLHVVARLASEHVKVVLTGEGSDELLGGYGRYTRTLANLRLGSGYRSLTPSAVRDLVRAGIDRLPAGSRLRQQLIRSFLYLPPGLESLYLDNFAVFSRPRQERLLTPAARERCAGRSPYAEHRALLERTDATSTLNRLLALDTGTYLHELLMKQDQMSMAASVESRVPFLDPGLVEFATRLPDVRKIRGLTTKWILRRSMKGILPPEILKRSKMGFPVPFGSWARGRHRPLVEELVLGDRAMARGLFRREYLAELVAEHRSGRVDHSERLWSLVNLELWQRAFIDGERDRDEATAAARAAV